MNSSTHLLHHLGVVLLLCLLTGKRVSSVECLQSQRSLLLQLKDALSFPSTELVSWRHGSNCCDWEGVACDTESGRVTGLDLSSRNLSGKIVSSLFQLTSLQTLSLAFNMPVYSLHLQDPNLQALAKQLRNLTELYLDCVDISDGSELYRGILSLPRLQVLSLNNCNISGSIPVEIFQLKTLNLLDLSNNQMLSMILPYFPRDSTIKKLIISQTNLSGYLPESIGNLKSLVELDVSSCQLSGLIPLSVGNVGLQNLTAIDLSNNTFSGPVPASLFSLPALQALRLHDNRLSGQLGEIPSGLHVLRILDLSSNLLEGPVPKTLSRLSGLEFLGLASNHLSGILKLDLFQGLRNLTYLDLSNNRLSVRDGHHNSSLSFPKLSILKLASCNLTKLPLWLRHQDRITTLDLSSNRISGDIPEWIWRVGDHTLTNLNLSYNLLTGVRGSMPEYFSSSGVSPIVVDLHSNMLQGPIPLPPRNSNLLDYSNNNFSSAIPSNISLYLNSTIFFSLANNSLTGEIPQSICDATNLQVLDFSYNHLRGPVPPCILEHSSELIVLSLRGNQLQGSIPSNISEGCALRTINLNSNHLEGRLPETLTNCGNLEVIDLGNNHLEDVFPFRLGYIFPTRILVLRSNAFYGTIEPPPNFVHNNFTFTKLQILDLSSNRFNGSLPFRCFQNLQDMMLKSPLNSSVVGHFFDQQQLSSQGFFYSDTVVVTSKGRDTTLVKILTVYKYIDFSNNRFEGDLPEDLGGLQSLCVLNLSHNSFTGPIPMTFGNLVQLESLDLSGNHLAGEIPQGLTSLTFLSFLNLSDNSFSGEIPQGNQFSTFSNSSYQDNDGLCGLPLSRKCNSPAPTSTVDAPPPSESSRSHDDTIELALSVGLGYGVGIALVLVFQSMSRGNRRRGNLVVTCCNESYLGKQRCIVNSVQIFE